LLCRVESPRKQGHDKQGEKKVERGSSHGVSSIASGGDFAQRSIAELNGAADAEFAHASLERGAFHAEESGGTLRTGDAPFRLAQGTQDVLAEKDRRQRPQEWRI
jgi:hypothetical protein